MDGPQQVEGALGQEPVERAGGRDSGAGANRGQRRHGLQAVVDEDDDGGIRWYEPRTTPWPSPARLNLMRAQYGLSLLDDARVEAVDAIRRLAAQVEVENNKKENTDE